MLQKKKWITEEIKEEVKQYRAANDNEDMTRQNPEPMGCSKRCSKTKVYSNTSPPQETRKSPNKQANFTSKAA